jgi:pSer/pThr/pTyr-binding forkhead associated (FHA) protein
MAHGVRRPGGAEVSRGPTRVRLRYRGNDLYLSVGRYSIGRSSACHIVIEQSLVSRRHAELVVTEGAVGLRDLGSINGVLVNDKRMPEGLHPLTSGDRFTIGNEEFELKLEVLESSTASDTTEDTRPTMSGNDPIVPASSADDSSSETSTTRVNAFDLIGLVADKALNAGRIREAEDMLRTHLQGVLQDLRGAKGILPETRAAAVSTALKLARATGSPRWFDYVIDVLMADRIALPEALADELVATLAKVGAVDLGRLERYAEFVRGLAPSFEKLRAVRRIDELLRAAATKKP